MAKLKVELADVVLMAVLAVIVVAYAAFQTPLLGLFGLLVLLALVGRDVFFSKTRQKSEEFVSLAGKKLRVTWILAASAPLSAVVAYFSTDLIRLLAVLLLVLNGISLFEKHWKPLRHLSSTVVEIDTAFFAALFFWLALGFVLNTSTPIDVVTSCSMLPNLGRGDLIFLQGGTIEAPEVQLSRPITPSDFVKDACAVRDKYSGTELQTLCTTGLLVDGTRHAFTKEGDILVYEPPHQPALGLIVHRAVLKLKSGGQTYYLTKGDNNPLADVEGITRSLATDKDVKGRMILRVPYVGYLKLFLALQFEEPAGCRRILARA